MRSTLKCGLLLACIVVAGCSASGGGAGHALSMLPASGSDNSRKASEDTLVAAMKGGIIATVAGETLSRRDQRKAVVAEYTALETAPVGQSVNWSNERSGLSGQVSASQPYQVGSQNCRQYTHTLRGVGAEPVIAKGTACRSENGVWTPLT